MTSNNSKPLILLDLDGVLTNFVAGVESRLGPIPPNQGTSWEIWSWYGMEQSAFWPLIDDFFFWADLPMYADGQELLAYLTEMKANYYFCSTPTLSPDCIKGKLFWIQKFFGRSTRNYIFTPAKELLAKSNIILIDDNQDNCEKFTLSGGKAVLWPRPWNGSESSPQEVILTLKQYLEEGNPK